MPADWHAVGRVTGSPAVLSVLAESGTLIIGGTGRLAVRDGAGDWRTSTPDLGAITALTATFPEPPATTFPELVEGQGQVPPVMITGGPLGLARSVDHGRTWHRILRSAPVTCLARSTDLLLAGTLGAGVLRSTDDGRSWTDASVGLPDDHVSAISFRSGSAIAATDGGLCRSVAEGRIWRAVPGTPAEPITALWADSGSGWALTESGLALRARGDDWREAGRLPAGAVPSAVLQVAGSLLAATSTGLYESAEGVHWRRKTDRSTYALAAAGDLLVAGTDAGLVESRDGGATWCHVALPALDDVSRLLPAEDRVLAYGPLSGLVATSEVAPPMIRAAESAWPEPALPESALPGPAIPVKALPGPAIPVKALPGSAIPVKALPGTVQSDGPVLDRAFPDGPLPGAPLPIITAVAGPDGVLLAAGPDGLARSTDGGRSWQDVDGVTGAVADLAPDRDGGWWAVTADGSRLLRSVDHGLGWTATAAPWGTSTPLALGVVGADLRAATRDGLGTGIDLWRGPDPHRLTRTGRLPADPDRVLISLVPPAAVIDDRWLVPGPTGWSRIDGPPGSVRRLIGAHERLLALTDVGLFESPDGGATWQSLLEADLGDAAMTSDATWALDRSGTVWRTSRT